MTDQTHPITYFLGANSAQGFVSLYEQWIDQGRAQAFYCIKGGAGCGKSTLMAGVAGNMEARGYAVEYIRCSGDPDSLDAVFCPPHRFLILDGTAPHIVDPRLPGAKDGILNLGACLDEGQLASQAAEIEALNRDIANSFSQAYRYLAAARACRDDAAAVYEAAFPEDARRELLAELRSLMPRDTLGPEENRFAQAVTWKGVLQDVDSILTDQAVSLDLPWGFDPDGLLSPLRRKAAWEGLKRSAYHDPLDAGKLQHLAVGPTVFTTAVLMDVPVFRPRLDESVLRREGQRLAFDRAGYELLLNQAVEALAAAKQNHDRLERYYVDAMDYTRLDEMKEAFFQTLP